MNTVTEEEAKTKWCPMYRVATSGGDPSCTFEMDNRQRDGIPPPAGSSKDAPWTPGPKFNPWVTCVGSGCMAWRWEDPLFEYALTCPGPDWEEDAVDGYTITLKTYQGLKKRWRRRALTGFCGLAGRP